MIKKCEIKNEEIFDLKFPVLKALKKLVSLGMG